MVKFVEFKGDKEMVFENFDEIPAFKGISLTLAG